MRSGSLVLGTVVYAWFASGFRPFTTTEEVLVAIPVLVALGLAAGPSHPPPPRRIRSSRWSASVWIVLVVAVTLMELHAYFSSPRADHPTLSSLADEVMSVRPGRASVFALWLGLGWVLVRRPKLGSP